MGNRTQPAHCSLPLSSRLDHLDFILKSLEGKRGFGMWGRRNPSDGAMERPLLPSDSSLKDSCYKGSLLDRIAYLENRLFQLCLELESSSTSSTSTATGTTGTAATTTTTSGYASSSQGSKGEPSDYSLPTFQKPNLQLVKPDSHQAVGCKSQIQGKSHAMEETKQNPTCSEQQVENEKSSKEQKKTSKSVKKKVSSKWPHLKLLGC